MRAALAGSAWFAHASIGERRWRRLANDVEAAQRAHLLRVLRANAATAFGREYGFEGIAGSAEYARRVPARGYDEFAPFVERIAAGEQAVLTKQPVRRLGVTSGTTRASKLIPYTDGLLDEFGRGIAPWVYRLFRSDPRLLATTTYWSVTPVDATRRTTPAGVPVGFDDDRSYVDPVARRVLGTLMPVPSAVARIAEIEAFRYATLRLLLQQEDLGWLSVWSPSFLTLLVRPLVDRQDELLHDLERGTITGAPDLPGPVLAAARARPRRARELKAILGASPVDFARVWPRLRLVSCWAHGAAASLLPELRRLLPNVAIQPKGLLATEAFVSFPFRDDLSALSLGSHFFEFVDVQTGDLALAHELVQGKEYSVLVTTSGGLYRYRLGDLVEVGGFARRCPLIRFVGREGNVSSLHGEKLDERFVRECGDELFARHRLEPSFWLLAPDGAARYTLFVQLPAGSVTGLGEELDELLRRNYHYDYCRRLGQLESCRVLRIASEVDAAGAFLAHRVARGQRLGEIKPAVLDLDDGWADVFSLPHRSAGDWQHSAT